jgi:hypothetical protein
MKTDKTHTKRPRADVKPPRKPQRRPIGTNIAMIFSDAGGLPAPHLPRDRRGELRVIDGITWLNIEQAAARFGISQERLALLWRSVFADILGDTFGGGK